MIQGGREGQGEWEHIPGQYSSLAGLILGLSWRRCVAGGLQRAGAQLQHQKQLVFHQLNCDIPLLSMPYQPCCDSLDATVQAEVSIPRGRGGCLPAVQSGRSGAEAII